MCGRMQANKHASLASNQKVRTKYLLKVNASATTFCRLFCSGTFWRPKKVADLLASFWCLFGILLEDKKRFATFCRPFPEKRTAKSRQGNFGRQKVAVEKRRQKVVALAFSLSKKFFRALLVHLDSENSDFCKIGFFLQEVSGKTDFRIPIYWEGSEKNFTCQNHV